MRIALLALALLATPALAAQTVALKAAPSDSDGVVTLGDLFQDAGAAANVAVATGPKGAANVVIDAARVQAVARAHGLAWPNAAGVRRVVVRGGAAAAEAAGVPAEGAEVLVYARSLKTGEILAAEDLTWAKATTRALSPEAPQDADDLIGLAAKKPLRAGSPASARDVAAPRVIAKDEAVSVQFRAGGVALSLQGKALTSAAAGEAVRVLNPQSKMVIDAVAIGPGVAVVGRDAGALKSARLAGRP